MGLAYLPTKLGSFGGKLVGKYTVRPIEHMGNAAILFNNFVETQGFHFELFKKLYH